MNQKQAKRIRRLLLPARRINGERLSSGVQFRGTTAHTQVLMVKETTNPKRIRFGRDKTGKLVQATASYRVALDPQCPRSVYQRAKRNLSWA